MSGRDPSSLIRWFLNRFGSTLAALLLVAAPLASCDRPGTDRAKVVILTPQPFPILDDSIAGIRQGLADAGYGPDRIDLVVVNAGGQSQLLVSQAREIVAERPAVIVPVSTPATQAVMGASPGTQNIVFSTVTDPARADVPSSSPYTTGVSDRVNFRANIDLLKELFPNARRVGTIYNPGDAAAVFGLEQMRPLLAASGIELIVAPATNSNEAVDAARALIGRVDAILIGSDGNAASAMAGISAVANRARIPVIAGDAGSVRDGALAGVSVDYVRLGRAGASLIVQVLEGRRAGQIPRVAFLGNVLLINPATARAWGYTFPAGVMARQPVIVRTP